MKTKPRWMKRVLETAKEDKTPLPFQRDWKAVQAAVPLKKAASA